MSGWQIEVPGQEERITATLDADVVVIARGDEVLFTCEGLEEPAIAACSALDLPAGPRMALIAWLLRIGLE